MTVITILKCLLLKEDDTYSDCGEYTMGLILDICDQSTPHGLQSSIFYSNRPMWAQGRKTQPCDETKRHFTPSSAALSVKQHFPVRVPILPYVLQAEAAYEVSLGSI